LLVAIAATLVAAGGVAAYLLVPRSTPRPPRPIAIDIPKESNLTQAEEDAIRRKLTAFEACFAKVKTVPAPGTKAVITHNDGVTLRNPAGVSTDLVFVFCLEAVDQSIAGVRQNAKYEIRL